MWLLHGRQTDGRSVLPIPTRSWAPSSKKSAKYRERRNEETLDADGHLSGYEETFDHGTIRQVRRSDSGGFHIQLPNLNGTFRKLKKVGSRTQIHGTFKKLGTINSKFHEWRRRNSLMDKNQETHEIYILSNLERREAKREAMFAWLLIFFEIGDVVLDTLNFYVFMLTTSGNDWDLYAVLYTLSTMMVTFLALYVIYNHFVQLRRIRREINVGVFVTRGRSRMERLRHADAIGLQDDDSESFELDETNGNHHKRGGKASEQKERLLEFELQRLERRAQRARFVVFNAIFEELLTFLFAMYRIGFTDIIINDERLDCIRNADVPANCVSSEMALILLQIAGSIFFMAIKISFFRDYLQLKSMILDKTAQLQQRALEGASILDQFGQDQVTEREINSVVQIKKLVQKLFRKRRKSAISMCQASDLVILHMLRINKNDLVLTSKAVREWMSFVLEFELGKVHQTILLQDMKFYDLPFVSKFASVIPYVDPLAIDDDKSTIIHYTTFCSNSDYQHLLELISASDAKLGCGFLLQWVLIILNHFSKKLHKVFSLTILCNCLGFTFPDGTLLDGLCKTFVSSFKLIERYPINIRMVMWKSDLKSRFLLEKLSKPNNLTISFADTLGELSKHVSFRFIPKAIGGEFVIKNKNPRTYKSGSSPLDDSPGSSPLDSSIESELDPWRLRKHKDYTISWCLGNKHIPLHYYSNVKKAEADVVLQLDQFLRDLEHSILTGNVNSIESPTNKNTLVKPNSPKQQGDSSSEKKLVPMPTLTRLATHLRLDVAANSDQPRKAMEDFLLNGSKQRLRLLPKVVTSHVALLRHARYKRFKLDEAALSFLKTCEWREQHNLHQISRDILMKDLAIDELPKVKELRQYLPIHPVYKVDLAHASIICFARTSPDFDPLTQLSMTDMKEAVINIFEYLNILAVQLSEQHKMEIRVQVVHYIDNVRTFFSSHGQFLNICSDVEHHFPKLVRFPHIGLTSNPAIVVETLAKFYGYFGSRTFKGEHLKIISVSQRGKNNELKKYVDLKCLPINLGGRQPSFDLEVNAIETVVFPKMRALCGSMTLAHFPRRTSENGSSSSIPLQSGTADIPAVEDVDSSSNGENKCWQRRTTTFRRKSFDVSLHVETGRHWSQDLSTFNALRTFQEETRPKSNAPIVSPGNTPLSAFSKVSEPHPENTEVVRPRAHSSSFKRNTILGKIGALIPSARKPNVVAASDYHNYQHKAKSSFD